MPATRRAGCPAATGWRAEEMFLRWLDGLPAGIDPSHAARAALMRLAALAGPEAEEGELGRLRALLTETMGWSRPALALLARRPGRRSRPGRRRSS